MDTTCNKDDECTPYVVVVSSLGSDYPGTPKLLEIVYASMYRPKSRQSDQLKDICNLGHCQKSQ